MDEQRQEAYKNLIERLLNCPNENEINTILNDNLELVDRQLIKIMEMVTKDLVQRGDRNRAQFLIDLLVQQVLPRTKNTPQRQAERLVMMGLYCCQRIIPGKRADDAIPLFKAALKTYTSQAFPKEWVETQNNLGNSYRESIRGERSQNMEESIGCYKAALEIHICHQFPQEWGELQFNLGNAYRERIRGKKEDNLKESIGCYKAALKVFTRQDNSHKWAVIMNSLAAAYRDQENLKASICCYKAALKVHTRKAFPEYWAGIQNNLAVTYHSDHVRAENDENLEEAICCFNAALEVYTRQAFPEYWASIQINLGAIYSSRRQGDRTENLKASIQHYTNALEVYTSNAFPQNYLRIQVGLGISYRYAQQLDKAHEAFATAIHTLESLRDEIVFGSGMEEDKKKLAGEWYDIYQHMVEICIQLGNHEQAIEYVDRSKARNLVELLANKNLYPKPNLYSNPNTYKIHCKHLDELRQAISTRQRQLEILIINKDMEEKYRDEIETIRQELNDLQQQKYTLIDEINQVDTNFKFTQKVESIFFENIQELLLDRPTAIIMWYIVHDKFLAFIIIPESPNINLWQSSQKDLKALVNWRDKYLKTYQEDKKQWQKQLTSCLQNLSQKILHLDDLLLLIPKTIQEIILIPHRFLHLFPLHALPISRETWLQFNQETHSIKIPINPCLLDCFKSGVQYIPSCQLLKVVRTQQCPDFRNLFAIQNPTEDLDYTNLEVETISALFPEPKKILAKQSATKEAVKNYQEFSSIHCGHFSCHGEFNFASPLESALILADKKWTLAEIFELSLLQCRLITLSACGTGLIDPSSLSDEYIGLPNGFLYAGSSSVVSSLWRVDDRATAYLMIKFLQNLKVAFDKERDISVAVALKEAQNWLRDITWKELEEWPNNLQFDSNNDREIRGKIERSIREIRAKNAPDEKIDEKPFQSPYHWAGFTAIGR